MMKFMLTNRRLKGMSHEEFNYQWGVVHVALMVTTPSAMQVFRRYVQGYALSDVSDDLLVYPQSDARWDGFATLSFEDMEAFMGALDEPDNNDRAKPHHFSAPEMIAQLTGEDVLHDALSLPEEQVVKLVNFFKRRDDVPLDEFHRLWREDHAPLALAETDLVHRYVQNPALTFDEETFAGTPYGQGAFTLYAGVEELWVDGGEGLDQFAARLRDPLRESAGRFADPEQSFTMAVTDRLRFQSALDPTGASTVCWVPPGIEVRSTPGQWSAPVPTPVAVPAPVAS
jgi:hypothetical protein